MSSYRNADSGRLVTPAFAAIHATVAERDSSRADQPSAGRRAAGRQVIPAKGQITTSGGGEAVKSANESQRQRYRRCVSAREYRSLVPANLAGHLAIAGLSRIGWRR